MTESHPLGPYVRRFLLEHVVADRCLSRNTQKSYPHYRWSPMGCAGGGPR